MTFTQVLSTLYHGDIYGVLSVLNQAKYVGEVAKNRHDDIFLCTGFSFINQNGKEFVVFYDLFSKQIIYQLNIKGYSLPKVLGLWCFREGVFIKKAYLSIFPFLVEEANSQNNFKIDIEYEIIKGERVVQHVIIDDEKWEYKEKVITTLSSFKTIEDFNNGKVYQEFPLSKTYNSRIFFGYDGFSAF